MKPLWTQTLAWIVAIVIAILLALATPDVAHVPATDLVPQGSTMPR